MKPEFVTERVDEDGRVTWLATVGGKTYGVSFYPSEDRETRSRQEGDLSRHLLERILEPTE